ncbi:MAG: universal stress protein, partial [Terriglobales bacterium]
LQDYTLMKLLIANDGSEGAQKALGLAINLAKRLRAKLHMIMVKEPSSFPTTLDEIAEEEEEANHHLEQVIADAVAQAAKSGVLVEPHVVAGHPVPTIVELERNGFDLLVIGYMGHSAIYKGLIGSTTDRLVELAPCHVLVAK